VGMVGMRASGLSTAPSNQRAAPSISSARRQCVLELTCELTNCGDALPPTLRPLNPLKYNTAIPDNSVVNLPSILLAFPFLSAGPGRRGFSRSIESFRNLALPQPRRPCRDRFFIYRDITSIAHRPSSSPPPSFFLPLHHCCPS
jgi:hypothetical protein